jgi:8-oxo-dGTP diphosphatase
MTPRRVHDIDWSRWKPVDPATLLFVVRRAERRVLLIRKKRGLGAGKINAPGGRIEPGESPHAAAVREVHEEVGVTPVGVRHLGELSFVFVDGYSLHVHVFRADDCLGHPCETPEAIPLWTDIAAIPYDEMWEDDRLWVPSLLADRCFQGRFIFDGERMLDHVLAEKHPASASLLALDDEG